MKTRPGTLPLSLHACCNTLRDGIRTRVPWFIGDV